MRIPDTWFRASSLSTTMDFLLTRSGREARRPLADGERRLGWFILPAYQRPPVWTLAQKVRFIESAWMRLPLGVFVWNDCPDDPRFDQLLLDGQQRITAILEYMADGFEVYGAPYSQVDIADRRHWEMATIFACLKTNLTNEANLRDVYDRLAYGGTPHPPKPEPWLGGRGPG